MFDNHNIVTISKFGEREKRVWRNQ